MCDATGVQAPVATPAHFVNEASDTISTKRNIPLTGEGGRDGVWGWNNQIIRIK